MRCRHGEQGNGAEHTVLIIFLSFLLILYAPVQRAGFQHGRTRTALQQPVDLPPSRYGCRICIVVFAGEGFFSQGICCYDISDSFPFLLLLTKNHMLPTYQPCALLCCKAVHRFDGCVCVCVCVCNPCRRQARWVHVSSTQSSSAMLGMCISSVTNI